jgi:predicted dehydrogenase
MILSSRRRFIRQFSTGVAGVFCAPAFIRNLRAQSPNGKIRHASFGCNGMALSDLTAIGSHPSVEMVAGCDVDLNRTKQFAQKFPEARIYQDYRELLEKEKDLQTVNVSTPDHMHAPIGLAALARGLHVYGQKPLTHDLAEARKLAELAKAKNAVTQMGIQVHSGPDYRTAVKLVQEGAIGKVKEIHLWSGKAWGDKGAKPDRVDPIPEGFNWDLWLGVCAERPFIGQGWYHPSNWRKRLDFGTGTFGDMGCHIYDPVYGAVALTAPLTVKSEGAAPNEHSWATDALIRYVFPGTAYTEGKTINVTWYDGTQRPPLDVQALVLTGEGKDGKPPKLPDQGSILIGTGGVMLLPHVSKPQLFGAAADRPVVPEKGESHWHQFVDAVKDGKKASTDFSYSGPLSETVLLGSVATRFPDQTLTWDAPALKFTGSPEATALVQRKYREPKRG